jgi:Family of unknown function (DUF6350)
MGAMAETIIRPADVAGSRVAGSAAAAPAPAPSRRELPSALVGIGVALWTALLGLACLVCLTLAAWVTADHHEDAVRPALATAVQAWLLAHHTGLAISGGSLGIVPLGLTAGLALLLMRGGRQAARFSGARDRFDCLTTALAVALPYGVVAALLTKPAQSGQVQPAPLQALAGASVLAFGCAGVGALREAGQWAGLVAAVPSGVRAVLRAAAAATAVIVGVGAALVVIGLASHAERAAAFTGSLHGGVPAVVLMAVLSVAYAPNVVVWASAFSVGPGFAVGAGTSVALGGVHLGAVPALPLLAPLPNDGSIPVLGWLAVLGPIGAGVLAGWLLSRARPVTEAPAGRWWQRYRVLEAGYGLAAGAVCGLALGVLGWLSAGPLGPGRMAHLGPSAWQVALAAAAEVGVLAGAASWLFGWRRLGQLGRPGELVAAQA